jgi:hypothetical protein
MYLQKVPNEKIKTLKATDEKRRIRIQIRTRNPVYGVSKDPDPYKNVTDPDYSLE